MSRSNYSEGIDNWQLIRWRGAVSSALHGKRGQAFLRELLAALDALPEKRLIENSLTADDDDQCGVCALGAVGLARGMDMSEMTEYDGDWDSSNFGISDAMAREIMFINDDGYYFSPRDSDRGKTRFNRVRSWAESHLRGEDQ